MVHRRPKEVPPDETAVLSGGPAGSPLGEPAPLPGPVLEGPPPRRRPPFPPPERELWPWLLLLLVLALAGVGIGLWLSLRDQGSRNASASTALATETAPTAPALSIPRVVGLTRAAAVDRLRSFGFASAVHRQASEKPAGTVVGQNPAAGARLARGATVILAVSQSGRSPGAARAAAPDVVGTGSADAVRKLRAAGLRPALLPVDSSRPAGLVTAQTPRAGTQVAKGGRIVLQVSRGMGATTQPGTVAATATAPAATQPATTAAAATQPATTAAVPVTVPNVVGRPRADAQAALRSAGLVSEVKGVPSAEAEGTVVAQAPKAGASLERGEHVLINVASGRKPGEGEGAPTDVPNVVGRRRADAQQALRGAGLVTEVHSVPSSEPAGTVVAQEPKAGTSAKRGAHVLINVSNG